MLVVFTNVFIVIKKHFNSIYLPRVILNYLGGFYKKKPKGRILAAFTNVPIVAKRHPHTAFTFQNIQKVSTKKKTKRRNISNIY
jgi:hypothetical protein